jgi:dTDP-glucose 4,6-dehydratase
MIICVDIDGTICSKVENANYRNAVPFFDRIDRANELFDKGHRVIYWTARGSETGIDWEKLTKKQLAEWGVKYHEVIFGKPHYDIYIDDKSIRDTVLDSGEEIINATITV